MQNSEAKTEFNIPDEVRGISRVLSEAGFENYLVGGCVRDLIRKAVYGEPVEPKDWDITTAARPEEIQKLFEDSFYENEFGTVGVKTSSEAESLKVVEVTPYRTETGYSDYRRPDKVEWARTIEEDLARRDFTINAIALKLLNFQTSNFDLVDPFDGQKDIKKKLIRTVGKPEERFSEDALRLLRALRFASELGFAIEHETQEAVEKHSELLGKMSKERIRDEFIKIVMSDSPAPALELAARLDLLKFISPELEKGIGVEQNKAHAYNVWEHLLRSLDHAARKGFPLHVRLATLFHDVAKPHTRRRIKDQWTFYGHEVVGARIAKKTLEELRFPKDIVDKVYRLVRWHMFFSETETITLSAVRRMVRNVGTDLIWDLMDVRRADRIGTGRPKETPYRLRKYNAMIEQVMRNPISVKQLAINGSDVIKIIEETPGPSPRQSGLRPRGGGPHIGYILEILLSEVLENPELNDKGYLEKRVEDLAKLDPKELEREGREARRKNAGEEEKETEKILEKYKVK